MRARLTALSPLTIDAALDDTLLETDTDTLTGGNGADLFIITLNDKITDFDLTKAKKNKEGDVVIQDGVVVT